MQHSDYLRGALRAAAATAFLTSLLARAPLAASAVDWPTFDGNASRAAWLNSDRSVNRQNVQRLKLHWSTTLDSVADSTPIFVEHVPSRSGLPMLFQTDRAGTTYGIDAASGSIVWRYKTTGPGITNSAPVLDPGGAAIYVPGLDGYVHKLDAGTGSELTAAGFPLQITLSTRYEKDASPLNIGNGYLYAATSGYLGDAPPYDGHVVAVRLSDGTTNVFNSLCSNLHRLLQGSDCDSVRSGIWARAGVVVDPATSMHGRVYFATGNGPFERKEFDFGDSVVALTADGSKAVESFTPTNYQQLWQQDLDLGSTAPAMLPPVPTSKTPLMAVQGGKGQTLYLLNRNHLGKVGGELQQYSLPGELFTAPAVWVDETARPLVFLGLAPSSGVMALSLVTDSQGNSQLQKLWSATVGGTSPVVANGLVFVAASGVVTALNTSNGHIAWKSTQHSAGGSIGPIHWESPIVVNGGLYISDGAGKLTAYTLGGK